MKTLCKNHIVPFAVGALCLIGSFAPSLAMAQTTQPVDTQVLIGLMQQLIQTMTILNSQLIQLDSRVTNLEVQSGIGSVVPQALGGTTNLSNVPSVVTNPSVADMQAAKALESTLSDTVGRACTSTAGRQRRFVDRIWDLMCKTNGYYSGGPTGN